MKLKPATDAHEVAYQDLLALVRKHEKRMTPLELLAVAANVVGKLIAMQDQTATTPEQAMQVVATNIEHGNAQIVAELMKTQGKA